MKDDCVVVDANIAFKCLHAGRGDLRERIRPGSDPQFLSPRFLFVEIFKHKERLEAATRIGKAATDRNHDPSFKPVTLKSRSGFPFWLGSASFCPRVAARD